MRDPLRELELILLEKIEFPFSVFWEHVERTADFLREADGVSRIIQQAVGLLVILVGPRGGGKTTAAVWWVQDRKETEPDTPIVSNVPITGAIYVPDILKFLATKLAIEGESGKNYRTLEDNTVEVLPRRTIPARMLIIIDEAAISGFEARGSGVGSPLHTYLLALSRKLNVDIVLISQMMCLAKGTLIQTPSGEVPIETLKAGDVVVDDTYWGRKAKKIASVSKQVHQRAFRISLESGHRITVSENHRFPVYVRQQVKRDVEASQLVCGDMLKIDAWRIAREFDPLCGLLGVIHAEANWRTTKGMKETNQLCITMDRRETELQDFVRRTVLKFRPSAHIGQRKYDGTNRFAFILSKKADVQFFKRKYQKFLRLGYFHRDRMEVEMASFLSGFFEGDGCVEPRTFTISACQSERNAHKLAFVELLLGSLFIPFHTYSYWRKVGGIAAKRAKEEGYTASRVKINGAYAGVFANTVGFISSTKQRRAEAMCKNLYARIVAIETLEGETEMYDLTIEGNAAPYFMANGIRSHNSMADKRAQWLADFYWLCEAKFVSGTWKLDFFRYRIYDEQYRKTNEWRLASGDAASVLFGKFDTYDIPNYEALAEAFTIQYQISDDDVAFYEDVRDHKKHIPTQPVSENVAIFYMRKALRAPSGRYPGETFLVTGPDQKEHRYEIVQRDWDMAESQYKYRAREIPNNTLVEDYSEGEVVNPEAAA